VHFFLAPPKNPPAGLETTFAFCSTGAAFFVAAPPPKMLNVPLPLAGVFSSSGTGTGAGGDPPNRLKVPLPLALSTFFAGGGVDFFGEEIEMVPGPRALFATEIVPAALAGCFTVFLLAPNEPNPPIPATAPLLDFFTGAFFGDGWLLSN